jgi:hypothetical protein
MPAAAQLLPPSGRPRLSREAFEAQLAPFAIDADRYPLLVGGLRGYYARTMGTTPDNDRGLYDDALFLYAPALDLFRAFNGNTDPAKLRIGSGTGAAKGMAALNPGFWPCYRFSVHGSRTHPHEAICQRAGAVTVTRDGTPPYADHGWFGINIHRGGNYGTSSEGCQTIPPGQWDEFIGTAQQAGQQLFGDRWRERTVGYVLLDAQDSTADAAATATATAPQPLAIASAPAFAETVIRPTLRIMGCWSEAAEHLLLGTAIAESGLKERVQRGGGPARGLFQMEPATHEDIWNNFLRHRPPLAQSVRAFLSTPAADRIAELEHNDRYACAMARVHYLRVKAAIPTTAKVTDLAAYWKAHYNTPAGKGTVQHFVKAWKQFMP